MNTMAKRTTKKAIEPDQREIPGAWVSASLIPGESSTSYNNQNTGRDYELVTRGITGTAYRAATINATVLSGQTLRLFRKTGTGIAKAGRKVVDKRIVKHATNRGRVKSLIGKAATYANRAGDEVEEVLDHPVLDLLQNPDPIYTGSMWLHMLFWFKEVAGRAYLYVGEKVNGVPVSAYILPSQFAWPMLSDTGFIAGYYYGRNRASPMRIAADDVVYLRQHGSPVHPAGGMSWLFSVMAETDMEAAALQAEAQRWLNGGMPGMVFKAAPTTTDAQMRQINAHLNQSTRGVGKAGSILLLRDTELIQYGTKPHEMQYVEGITTTEKRIYDAAGIPEPIYRLNSANLASATVANAQYMRYTIAPRLATLAGELTELLLPHYGVEPGEMWFCFDDPTQDDQIALATELRAAEAQGIITPNEYRAVMDLEALPDEANLMRYRQTEAPAPMGIFGGGMPTPAKAEDMPSEDVGEASVDVEAPSVDEDATPEDNPEVTPEDAPEVEAKSMATKPCDRPRVPRKYKAATLWDEATGVPTVGSSLFRRFLSALTGWYTTAVPSMIDDTGIVQMPDNAAIADLNKIADRFVADMLRTGAMDGLAKIGMDPDDGAFNVASETAMSYVRNRGLELAKTIPETLKGHVAVAIEKQLAAGTSIADLRDAIRKVAPDLTEWQAVRIARTETAMAYCEGNRQAWEQQGVATKAWIVAGGPCPICEGIGEAYPNDIPIGEAFSTGSGSWQAPPAHPNCRCDLLPGVEYVDDE
jgi:phage portal protein BeeE